MELNEENKDIANIDNLSESGQSQQQFNTISKDQENEENQNFQQDDSSLHKESNNHFPPEIMDLNDDDVNININNNFIGSPIYSIQKDQPKENIIPKNPTSSKLNTLINSNENFKEIYNMINNNIPSSNKKLTKNNSNNIYKCNKIDPLFQRTSSQRKKDTNFSNASLNELLSKNIHDVKQMKLTQKENSSLMKGKMSMLYGEIEKFAEKKYYSKSIGPYLRNNKSNTQIQTSNNKSKTNIGANTKSMQHLLKIRKDSTNNENDSFYNFRNKHKKNESQYLNKRNTFTSVNKWIENESNPHSFYKEKEKMIQNLLSSVHGNSFRNDYSNLNRTSYNVNANSKYNNNFYMNELNAFTMRLHKQCNTTVDKKFGMKIDGSDPKRRYYFNSRNVNGIGRKRENLTEGVIPFYRVSKINLYKCNKERKV